MQLKSQSEIPTSPKEAQSNFLTDTEIRAISLMAFGDREVTTDVSSTPTTAPIRESKATTVSVEVIPQATGTNKPKKGWKKWLQSVMLFLSFQ